MTLGQAAAVFILHQLESSTNSPRFVPWQLELTCFNIGLAQWFGAMVWRMNIARIDIARMWPGVYAWTGLTLACSQREKSAHCSCICHACIHTYIQHTYIPTVLPSRSFTTSFVFPSFSDPATTFETHYWKKLTCGVIRSFNSGTKKHGEIISCRNYQMAMNLCPPISDIYI